MLRLRSLVMFVSKSGPLDSLSVSENITSAVVTHVLFETGSDELKLMEQKVYVASGRFIIETGKPPVVEYVITFGFFASFSIFRDL
jgi:Protein of unknown function (DUF3237)